MTEESVMLTLTPVFLTWVIGWIVVSLTEMQSTEAQQEFGKGGVNIEYTFVLLNFWCLLDTTVDRFNFSIKI